MNIIKYPNQNISIHFNVPYLCNDNFTYDRAGFLSYPSRAGVNLNGLLQSKEVDWDQWAPFLQAWLCFGFLDEVAGQPFTQDMPHQNFFLAHIIERKLNGSRVVTTRNLTELVYLARSQARDPSSESLAHHLSYLYSAIRRIVLSPSFQRYMKKGRRSTTPFMLAVDILISVQIIAETFRTCWDSASVSSILHNVPSTTNVLVDILLLDAGWCPYEIQRLPNDFLEHYNMCCITRDDAENHKNCTQHTCFSQPGLLQDEPQVDDFIPSGAGVVFSETILPDGFLEPHSSVRKGTRETNLRFSHNRQLGKLSEEALGLRETLSDSKLK
ncbi:hypothetical protein CC78DRAFT_615905 [Lojkania enalia]|uniref:Uncharacterized protein n=1 Tax=Lojkania enalia TaxID=147567 RepID=A0A9P4KG72_9PLEO|nr:hypothetical protein CC78DRAFT_615905 [Didymosphaeria enalia]